MRLSRHSIYWWSDILQLRRANIAQRKTPLFMPDGTVTTTQPFPEPGSKPPLFAIVDASDKNASPDLWVARALCSEAANALNAGLMKLEQARAARLQQNPDSKEQPAEIEAAAYGMIEELRRASSKIGTVPDYVSFGPAIMRGGEEIFGEITGPLQDLLSAAVKLAAALHPKAPDGQRRRAMRASYVFATGPDGSESACAGDGKPRTLKRS